MYRTYRLVSSALSFRAGCCVRMDDLASRAWSVAVKARAPRYPSLAAAAGGGTGEPGGRSGAALGVGCAALVAELGAVNGRRAGAAGLKAVSAARASSASTAATAAAARA